MFYVFDSLTKAQIFVSSVNNGEGYPKPDTLTLVYCDYYKHYNQDRWAVYKDAITESYYQSNAIEEISNLNDWVEL